MDVVKWEKNDSVAVVTMCNGENRHNPSFAEGMLRCFDEILKDESNHAVILTSTDQKNFSQGIDVGWLLGRKQENDLDSIKKFMYSMNNVFKTILLYPMPVIAAINGHAFGNGAIIACACDFRFMKSDKGFFCFPEVDISIPFLPSMIAWVKKAIPYYKFMELKLTGKRATAPELERDHVIVKACTDQTDLMNQAMEFAKTFHKRRGIYGEMKKRLNKDVIEIMEKEDPVFIEPLFIMVEG
ncbi:MAG: enoyl-CoA hydratase/isomerase family protein [Spirochaetes bacterium]|nr:enoyl-CoA hydratase/isomerase family protein [Spirochaetota bacterium]